MQLPIGPLFCILAGPFVQGPSRVAGENGSAGLGLAIARAIVSAHGGRIWVAGSGPGTRIRFSLPAA
ncbi:MAG: ATP-binding protein [Sciscionella sp.]